MVKNELEYALEEWKLRSLHPCLAADTPSPGWFLQFEGSRKPYHAQAVVVPKSGMGAAVPQSHRLPC